MKNKNSKGSILVLVLLIGFVIIYTCIALLSTSVMNDKMKKLNSKVKRAFYTAEGALEEAYVISEDFVEAGVEYAKTKECSRAAYLDFLLGKCEDMADHHGLVYVLEDKSNYSIYNASNTTINAELLDKTDFYQLEIVSCCFDDKIEKRLKLICNILIPDNDFSPDSINVRDYLSVVDWMSER